MITIEIANQQDVLDVDEKRLTSAAETVLAEAAIDEALISLAIVDDPTIHDLNRRYLQHDYATDVLSFVLELTDTRLEGEVIVSSDTAQSQSRRWGWAAEDELLLYVIHGMLHLVGAGDTTPEQREEMRRREGQCLASFGLRPHWEESDE
ncbi:MAG: rRNA maturation RNase YbeY [Planctomycetota bacterium]|nr:rRNA maturation RNase YbeY [Planctomycetota bacterium]